MAHVKPPALVVEPDLEEGVPAGMRGGATPEAPVTETPEWVDWTTVEKDPRYQKAAPKDQETVRQRYWDSYLASDPRISGLPAERQKQIMEKFIRPPAPESAGKKAVKKTAGVAQQYKEAFPGSEMVDYFVSEAIGGTLAAGGGGLAAAAKALLEGRTDIIPEVYTKVRDTLRQYLVVEPSTKRGKELVEKAAPVAAWPVEKVDQGIKAVEDQLVETLEPKLGIDQAAAIALGIGEGLRGTLIYGTLGLGGRFGAVGSVEKRAGVQPPAGVGSLEGPPVRPQLEGPSPFDMPMGEQPRALPPPEALYTEPPTVPKLLEGPVDQSAIPSPTGPEIASPSQAVQAPASLPDIFEGEYRVITPEPVVKPSAGMTIEELRHALLTDEMTGLPNRRAYDEAPKRAVQVLNDVDGLKYINDNFGHAAGDSLLKTIAQVAREEGLDVYRAGKGADEFVTQFDSTGEAYQALGRLQQRLADVVIEAEKPDGTKTRFKGLSFSYGVGPDLSSADKALNANKLSREQKGLRASRGGRPPGLEEIPLEPAKGDKVSGVASEGVEKAAPTPPPPKALLPEQPPSSPVDVGGGLAPEPALPIQDATLRRTRREMIEEAALKYRAQKRGEPVPATPPVVEVQPKPVVTESGPRPRKARPDKGMPVVRLTEEQFEAEVKRSKKAGDIDVEEMGFGGTVRLYSGIPLDEARALIRMLRSQVGTRFRVGEDLSLLHVALKQILTPSFLSKVDPIAADFVATNQALRHGVYYRTVADYNATIDRIVKDLTPAEKTLVGQLLDSYNNVTEIPVDLLNTRRDITPKVLDAFTAFRTKVFDPLWDEVVATAPPEKTPAKVHEYFTRVYEDFLQLSNKGKDRYDAMIRTFAEENGLDYADAYRIFHRQVPQSGFFGPVSKSRTAPPQAGRVWDVEKVARMYTAGVGRKVYLDQMLPLANRALEQLEHPQVRKMLQDYIDRQRGIPDSDLRSALQANPIVSKLARFEALRQYTSKLGVRPVLAVINATQYPLLDGTKALSRALFEEKSWGPMHSFFKASVDVFTEEGRALVDRSGVRLGPTGWTPDPRSLRSMAERVAHYAGWMHRMVDEYSRAASYLRNYYDAQRLIQKKGIRLLPEEEFMAKNLYAMKGVAETQFFYDVSGSPAFYSNPLLANLGRFKQYTINMAGFVANLPARELVIFLGMLELAGGPDGIPGLRQIYAQLRRRHPDSLATRVLNGLQEWSVAGMTGLDIGEQVGFGFIPGASTDADIFREYRDDFWKNVGRQISGPTVLDIANLWKDLETGTIDLSDPDWVDILGSRSASGISVTMQKGVRGLKEWDQRYTEWARGRKGIELSKKDVIARAVGIDTTAIARRQQEYQGWRTEVEDAVREKERIEDDYVKFIKDARRLEEYNLGQQDAVNRVLALTDRMEKFNQKYGTTLGVFVTADSVREAYVNSFMDPEYRMGRSRLQKSLLLQRLDPYRERE